MTPHPFELITFDVYTALFDVEGSLTPVVHSVLGAEIDALEFVRVWRRKQLEYALISNSLQRERVPWDVITRRTLDHTLGTRLAGPSERVRQELVGAWDHLHPWPEVGAVLEAVKSRGVRMGLLSNGDERMLRAVAARLPIPFDEIFASDEVGHYKPDPRMYALPLQRCGLTAEQLLHVAGSATDVMGAKAAGLHCVWSNRKQEPVLDPRFRSDAEFVDLRGLLEFL